MSNQTIYQINIEEHFPTTQRIVLAVILSLVITIGGSANIIVAWVLYKEKNLRKTIASIFLMNLLVIDVLNLLLVMPFSATAIIEDNWQYGVILMRCNALLATSLELASMLALAVISLDRLAAVMKPLVYRARMTGHKALQLTIYIWTQAILFSLIPIPTTWYTYNYHYGSCTFLSDINFAGFYIYMVLLFVFNFFVSLMIILITYFYIFRVARSHSKRISCAIQPSRLFNVKISKNKVKKETYRQREIRTASKILFVIGAFVLCHLPYALIRTYDLVIPYHKFRLLPKTLTIATKILAFSKSAFDPFIYFLLQKRFRKSLRKILFRKKNSIKRRRSNQKTSTRTNCSVISVMANSINVDSKPIENKIKISPSPGVKEEVSKKKVGVVPLKIEEEQSDFLAIQTYVTAPSPLSIKTTFMKEDGSFCVIEETQA